MISVIKPVVAPGFGFAVIEDGDNGRVVFHDDERRNLIEQFFLETDMDKRLRSVVAARRAELMDLRYWGQDYRAYVAPLKGLPWSLVTYYEKDAVRSVNVDSIVTTLLFLIPYMLGCMGICFLILIWPQRRATWLWPHPRGLNAYLELAVLYIVVIGVFGAAIYAAGREFGGRVVPDWLLILFAFAIPTLAWLVTYLRLRAGAAGFPDRRRRDHQSDAGPGGEGLAGAQPAAVPVVHGRGGPPPHHLGRHADRGVLQAGPLHPDRTVHQVQPGEARGGARGTPAARGEGSWFPCRPGASPSICRRREKRRRRSPRGGPGSAARNSNSTAGRGASARSRRSTSTTSRSARPSPENRTRARAVPGREEAPIVSADRIPAGISGAVFALLLGFLGREARAAARRVGRREPFLEARSGEPDRPDERGLRGRRARGELRRSDVRGSPGFLQRQEPGTHPHLRRRPPAGAGDRAFRGPARLSPRRAVLVFGLGGIRGARPERVRRVPEGGPEERVSRRPPVREAGSCGAPFPGREAGRLGRGFVPGGEDAFGRARPSGSLRGGLGRWPDEREEALARRTTRCAAAPEAGHSLHDRPVPLQHGGPPGRAGLEGRRGPQRRAESGRLC